MKRNTCRRRLWTGVLACAVMAGSGGMTRALAGDVQVRPQDDLYLSKYWADPGFVEPHAVMPFEEEETPSGAPRLTPPLALQLREILESAASSTQPSGTRRQRLGDFLKSFLDAEVIERLGTQPLAPVFARIDAIHDVRDATAVMGHLGTLNIPTPLHVTVERSPTNSALMQARLASSDMDFSHLRKPGWLYPASRRLDDPPRYAEYIERMMSEAGDSAANAHARQILSLESQIDEIARTRHPADAGQTALTLDKLNDLAPGIAWRSFMNARGFDDKIDTMVVENPYYVHAIDSLLAKTPVDTIKAYLKFKCVDVYADYLPRRIASTRRNFASLSVVDPDHGDRWHNGIDLINVTLAHDLGHEYVDRYFSKAKRNEVSKAVDSIRSAYRLAISKATWLDDESRRRALRKLDTMSFAIGYPLRWEDDSALVIRREELVGNMMRIAEHRNQQQAALVGKRIDNPIDTLMLPQSGVFRYIREDNRVLLPAFGLNYTPFGRIDAAEFYGSLGVIIAHEISHAFGPISTFHGEDANAPIWLTDAALQRYTDKLTALAAQFNENPPRPYAVVPNRYAVRSYALEESLATLTGVQVSYSAYRIATRGKRERGPFGEKRFFYAFAKEGWDPSRRNDGLETRWFAHAPGYFTTNATVRNLHGFYRAFDVKPMDALYLPKDRRITLW